MLVGKEVVVMRSMHTKVLQRFETLDASAKKKIVEELQLSMRRHGRYAVETELYRYFRIPPFIITRDREILFTENVE